MKTAKYYVEITGDFGGDCIESYREPFNTKKEAENFIKNYNRKWDKLKIVDRIEELKTELAKLEKRKNEIEKELKILTKII